MAATTDDSAPPRLAPWLRLPLTLVIGTIGGALFHALNLPLPWMLGSMTACLVAVLAGAPLASARRFRPPLLAVLGVALGSSFSADIFSRGAEWYPVVAAVLATSLAISAMAVLYLIRVARFDPVTAYFSGMPGALYDMIVQGGQAGGDEQKIALVQAARLFFVVLMVPMFFRLAYGVGSNNVGFGGGATYTAWDIGLLSACAIVGWPLGRLLRLPNPPFLGPLLLSGLVHVLGQSTSAPPAILVNAVQMVLGSIIGAQFIGAPMALLARILMHGFVMIGLAVGICVIFAVALGHLIGMDPAVIVLALAPGGMAEMCLIALALHADVTFVTVNQLIRIVAVQIGGPLAYRLLRGRLRKPPA